MKHASIAEVQPILFKRAGMRDAPRLLSLVRETDEWLRRRIRMCIWKAWKKVKTKVANLIRCGIGYEIAQSIGNARQSYWRMAKNYCVHTAISTMNLKRAGYSCLMDAYLEWYPK
jgi:hypothetical protein